MWPVAYVYLLYSAGEIIQVNKTEKRTKRHFPEWGKREEKHGVNPLLRVSVVRVKAKMQERGGYMSG